MAKWWDDKAFILKEKKFSLEIVSERLRDDMKFCIVQSLLLKLSKNPTFSPSLFKRNLLNA
jgi:hypothetical protein